MALGSGTTTCALIVFSASGKAARGGEIVDRRALLRRAGAGQVLQPAEQAFDALGVACPSMSANSAMPLIAVFSGLAFWSRMTSRRCSVCCADSRQVAADIGAGDEHAAACRSRRQAFGASGAPPLSETAVAPVRPWKETSTLVSARIGVPGSTRDRRGDTLGIAGIERRSRVTAPTRTPLNRTLGAEAKPRHRLLEAQVVDRALAEAAECS